jgi:hypothetical protein
LPARLDRRTKVADYLALDDVSPVTSPPSTVTIAQRNGFSHLQVYKLVCKILHSRFGKLRLVPFWEFEKCKTSQSRLEFALAVQRSAAYVADVVYQRILSRPVVGDALFTAGGTGAGKTTAIRTNSQTSGLISEAAIVYDSNFNSLRSARAKMTLALEAGLRAIVIFVHRHPVEAYLQGVLPRALVEGPTVSIEGHLRMHRDALKTFLRCQRVFADNPQAAFLVLNNTGHEAELFRLILLI